MKGDTKIVIGILGFTVLLVVSDVYGLVFHVLPRMHPMLDHDVSFNYSRVLSQVNAEDLAALSISYPTHSSTLTEAEVRNILQRLHDNQLFPEWSPTFKLTDSKGKPVVFSVRIKDPDQKNIVFSGTRKLRQGDFIFSVKPSTLPFPVEAP